MTLDARTIYRLKSVTIGPHYPPNPLPLSKLGEEGDAERSEAGKGEGFSDIL